MQKEINWVTLYTRKIQVICHITFWLMVTVIYYLSYKRLDVSLAWFMVLKDLFAVTTIFYLTAYLIIPKWLLKGKILFSIIWILFIYLWWASLTYYACLFIDRHFVPSMRLAAYIKIVLTNGLSAIVNWAKFPFYLLDFAYLTALPVGLKLMQSLVNQGHKKTILERDNLVLELNFLKSQLNPHFLFNILNNIYIMINKNDPKAAETVLNLAELMQYNLYESNFPYVLLSNETKFISNYLELESLRYGSSVQIISKIQENIEEFQIVPLILFPFIENAFKHGPGKSRVNAWVKIELNLSGTIINLQVSNSLNQKYQGTQKTVGGIGLQNVNKRLKLHYNNLYDIKVDEKEDSYSVQLHINLDTNNKDNLS